MFRNYLFDDVNNIHSFEIHNIDVAYINSLRRIILTDIETIGFVGEDNSTIEIITNTGPLHNEILAHRIGLIPLHIDENETESYEDNDLVFELNVINSGTSTINIETSHFTGKKKDKELNKNEIKTIFPPNKITKDFILITKLRANEQIHFIAKAVKKSARFNSSFSPVCLCNFFYMQDPKKAEKIDNILDKERAYQVNKYGDANAIQFEIEQNNDLKPKYLMSKAIEILISKLDNLRNNITNDNTDDVTITKFKELNNTYDIIINNEDDTLGNTIQSFIHNKFVREKKVSINNIACPYVGYVCPHPLKNLLKIRISLEYVKDDDDEDDKTVDTIIQKELFIDFLETNCRDIISELIEIKTAWNNFI